jgi:phosphatidylserine/phosphatidylglycerophosphate/cardiolipin synthase-like enzyme
MKRCTKTAQVLTIRLLTIFLTVSMLCIYASTLRIPEDDTVYAHLILVHGSKPVLTSLFSPDDSVRRVLLGLIKSEQQCIDCAIFSMTDLGIAQELINAKDRGVIVTIIADGETAMQNRSVIGLLHESGIPVYLFPRHHELDNAKAHLPLMHDKFFVFNDVLDGKKLVWTGSFNVTYSAAYHNQENVVVIENNQIYDAYKKQFLVIKGRCDGAVDGELPIISHKAGAEAWC